MTKAAGLPQQALVAPNGGYERVNIDDLLLDVKNPRLAELGITSSATQFDLVKALWDEMAVEEVAMSIAYSGYFDHEPLFVEPMSKGKYIVIEGNRRFAAVKLLVDASAPQENQSDKTPNHLARNASNRSKTLPVIVTTRKESWRYLGFKHVNGPATWGSYAKAQYIAHVHNDYDIPLERYRPTDRRLQLHRPPHVSRPDDRRTGRRSQGLQAFGHREEQIPLQLHLHRHGLSRDHQLPRPTRQRNHRPQARPVKQSSRISAI